MFVMVPSWWSKDTAVTDEKVEGPPNPIRTEVPPLGGPHSQPFGPIFTTLVTIGGGSWATAAGELDDMATTKPKADPITRVPKAAKTKGRKLLRLTRCITPASRFPWTN